MLTGPGDARNLRQDITRFWPFSSDDVVQAIHEVHTVSPRLEVAIFCLPLPPVQPQSSFARRSAIVLAPGYSSIPATTSATLCTHELGHVLTWAYLDPCPDRWRSYLEIRGISADAFGPDVPHAERAREILAEDFRFLFGGRLATSAGSIENHRLPLPDQVQGLKELLTGYCQGQPRVAETEFSSRAFPNPCNPATTIEMVLPPNYSVSGAGDVELTVFDIRGRQVRRIHNGLIANGRLAMQWDGCDESSQIVASGRYLYQLRGRGLDSSGSVLLVR
ncbi:MAG: FlgD immunoglobulin-like domain containing protein [bacterium]